MQLEKKMHISHNLIATNTCLSYEF